jgi:hypothetical protein
MYTYLARNIYNSLCKCKKIIYKVGMVNVDPKKLEG